MALFDALANIFAGQSPTTTLSSGDVISWNAPKDSFLAPLANLARPISRGLETFNQVLNNTDPQQARPISPSSPMGVLKDWAANYNVPSAGASLEHLNKLAGVRPQYYASQYGGALAGLSDPDRALNTQIKQEQLRRYQDPMSDPATKLDYELKQQQIEAERAKRQAEIDKMDRLRQVMGGVVPTGINPAAQDDLNRQFGQPLSVRNNNPLNMRPVGASGGFQTFGTPQEGIDAATRDLTVKISGQSPAMKARFGENYAPNLSNLITTWAPPSENDTQNYIDFVARKTGIDPNQVLTTADIPKLLPAMAEMEGGKGALASFGMTQPSIQQPVAQPPQYLTQLEQLSQIDPEKYAGTYLQELADYQEKQMKQAEDLNKPQTLAGQLQQDYDRGLISKEVYDSQVTKMQKDAKKSQQEADEKEKGQSQLDDLLTRMNNNLNDLNDLGGLVSEERGFLSNIGSAMASSEDGALFGVLPSGQELGRRFGTKEQTIRDKLAAQKLAVLRAIQKSTGMSSQQLNSNVELQNMLNSIDNPQASYEARKATIKMLSEMYGSGALAKDDSVGGWKVEEVK